MTRIRLQIDRLVLSGFAGADAKALAAGLESELAAVLADRQARSEWARSRRTPVLELRPVVTETGTAAARKLGKTIGQSIGRGIRR